MFLFTPETQYYRNYVTSERQENDEAKDPGTEAITEVTPLPKKTFLQELQPWSKINPNASYIHLLVRPWPLVIYPAVIFAFLIFSVTLAWVVVFVNVNASIFQAPPYLMTAGIDGLVNVPAVIGIAIGSFVGGALTDYIAEKKAKSNNGVFEPEFRLIALVFPGFIVPAGLLMYTHIFFLANFRFGFGVQRLEPWALSWTGYGCLAFGLASVPAIVMTYGSASPFHR